MIIYWFLVVIALVLLHILQRYSKYGRKLDKIPGPTPYPLVGNLLYFIGSNEYLWSALYRLSLKYRRIWRVWLGIQTLVTIQHPDDIEILLTSKKYIDKGSILTDAKPFSQEGVLFSSGEKYRRRRKMIALAFNKNNLKDYIETTTGYGDLFIEHLKSLGDETSQSLGVVYPDLMLRIVCGVVVGVDANELGTENVQKYNDLLEYMIHFIFYRASRPYLTNRILLSGLVKEGRKLIRIAEEFHGITHMMYTKRREYYHQINKSNATESESIDTHEDIETKCVKKQAILDKLLAFREEGSIDDHGVKEELNTIIVAAHDTLATALVFTTMLLAENKFAQNRARAEVTEILDKTGGKITYTEIQQFEYLERCIKEALRMYPSAPMIIRYLTEDLQLKNHLVPAGTDVMIMIYAMQRNSDFWPEPKKFDPDRFLPENVKERHPYAYVPFSAGPRSCIGLNLGMMQLKCLIGSILYNFNLEPVDRLADVRFYMHLTLHSTKPVHVKFVKIIR